jgi:TRAP-type C4-dicarboxylate transport system permease small subunit
MKYVAWLWRHLEEVLGGIALIVVVVTVSTNVFLRYVLNDSFEWGTEVANIMFVWIIMMGIGAAARHRLHPTIDLVTRLLPIKAGVTLDLLMSLVIIYVLGQLTIITWDFALLSGFFKYTGTLELPYIVVYLALPIGFGLMLVRVAIHMIDDIRALLRGDRSELEARIGTSKTEELL